LKAAGKYVARGLSFRNAEFLELEAPLTQRQAATYDAAAELWQARFWSDALGTFWFGCGPLA
jgi:hypothetical protein